MRGQAAPAVCKGNGSQSLIRNAVAYLTVAAISAVACGTTAVTPDAFSAEAVWEPTLEASIDMMAACGPVLRSPETDACIEREMRQRQAPEAAIVFFRLTGEWLSTFREAGGVDVGVSRLPGSNRGSQLVFLNGEKPFLAQSEAAYAGGNIDTFHDDATFAVLAALAESKLGYLPVGLGTSDNVQLDEGWPR